MKKGAWIFIGIIALLAILAYTGTRFLQDSINSQLNPIKSANDALKTQVAQLLNPTPTVIPEPVTYIREIREIARLETIQYSVEKVITAEIGQGALGFLFGDRLLLVAHGTVIAGIDMQKMDPSHLRLRNNVLYVTLPPAEIFITSLDNQKSYVYDRETGLLTRGDINLEKTARQAAENEILNAAIDDGILTLAQQNAETYLERFFQALGYPQVIFE